VIRRWRRRILQRIYARRFCVGSVSRNGMEASPLEETCGPSVGASRGIFAKLLLHICDCWGDSESSLSYT
jgi:hypothetical protein